MWKEKIGNRGRGEEKLYMIKEEEEEEERDVTLSNYERIIVFHNY